MFSIIFIFMMVIIFMNFNKILAFVILIETMSVILLIFLMFFGFTYSMIFMVVIMQTSESVLILSLLLNVLNTWKGAMNYSF